MLIYIRDNEMAIKSPIGIIESVGFRTVEYNQLPKDFNVRTLSFLSESQLRILTSALSVFKSPPNSKSDVYINGEGYSVKSLASAPPALVNHTARPGFEVVCNHTGVNISELDMLINEYWKLRTAGNLREDVKNTEKLSPFRTARHLLEPVLHYFLFLGTGKGLSNHPAEFILDFIDPVRPETWRKLTSSDVIDEVWDRLIFSVRAKKGMPSDYPNNRDTSNNTSIEKWTCYFQDEYRGALHIRVKP